MCGPIEKLFRFLFLEKGIKKFPRLVGGESEEQMYPLRRSRMLGQEQNKFWLTAALCAATDGLSPFDRKFSSPTRAQTAALLQKSAE